MNSVTLRQWHTYLGMFIAPSVLFFSLTGSLQLFGLHEEHGDYQPATIIEKFGMLHKDQVFALKKHRESQASGEGDHPDSAAHPAPKDDGDEPPLRTVLLKWFFLFVALSLALSTILGLTIGLTQGRRKRVAIGLLLAGALIPVCLLVF
jgi:hypothetical protein